MRNNILLSRVFLGALLIVVGMMSLTGCMSLRKKFTRVKKNKDVKEEFIPVLQPVEYKRIEETPKQVYAQHYSMVRVYFKDFWDALDKRSSGPKREKYMLTEILSHVDAMMALLVDARQKEAKGIRDRLAKVLAFYDGPDAMRRYDLLTGALRLIERDLYRLLKPTAVDAFLVLKVS